jgi:hypothetical protein
MVAMAHPDLLVVAGVEKAFKDRIINDLFDERPTEFAAGATFDLAASCSIITCWP